MSLLMLLRSEYFNFFNSRPMVFGDARRLHGVCLSMSSDGSREDSVEASRAIPASALAAVFEAGFGGAKSAVPKVGAVGSSDVESVLDSAAGDDCDSRSLQGSILASDRRLLRVSFRLPSGSPPVCGSISEVRSASSVGSFFFCRWSSASFSSDSLARASFQSRLEFSATRLHRFGIESRDPGYFSYASPTENRRNHRRYPPTMFLIQLIAN